MRKQGWVFPLFSPDSDVRLIILKKAIPHLASYLTSQHNVPRTPETMDNQIESYKPSQSTKSNDSNLLNDGATRIVRSRTVSFVKNENGGEMVTIDLVNQPEAEERTGQTVMNDSVSPPSIRPVCFHFEMARAPRHLSLGGTLWGNFQGHQGNAKGAWRQSPSLPPWSIRPAEVLFITCGVSWPSG